MTVPSRCDIHVSGQNVSIPQQFNGGVDVISSSLKLLYLCKNLKPILLQHSLEFCTYNMVGTEKTNCAGRTWERRQKLILLEFFVLSSAMKIFRLLLKENKIT